MGAFFEMGGYGGYVWPAYGFAASVLSGMALASLRRLRRAEAQLRQLEALVDGDKRAAETDAA